MKATFTVDEVRGKGRPRFWNGHAVTPPETRAYEAKIKQTYIDQCGYQFTGAVKIYVFAFLPIPKSTSKKRKLEILDKSERPLKKPDIDNICKSVMDSLNGVAFPDDAYVTELKAAKFYGNEEKLEIVIEEV